MRGKRAKQLRRQAHVVAQDYPELDKYGYAGHTYYTYGWRRIYRQMKREWSRKLT